MIKRHIGDYHFLADNKTGVTMRWGRTMQENPIWAPVPELADISISNHCTKGCSFCYRNSGNNQEWMSTEDYCNVLDAMNHPKYGNVFQVALGGGEPLEYPEFLTIIDETVKRGIVPFKKWQEQEFESYKSYNNVKHNRYECFNEANLGNLMNAVAGLLCILHAQIGENMVEASIERVYSSQSEQDKVHSAAFLIKAPKFPDEEQYEFVWDQIKNEAEPVVRYLFV